MFARLALTRAERAKGAGPARPPAEADVKTPGPRSTVAVRPIPDPPHAAPSWAPRVAKTDPRLPGRLFSFLAGTSWRKNNDSDAIDSRRRRQYRRALGDV